MYISLGFFGFIQIISLVGVSFEVRGRLLAEELRDELFHPLPFPSVGAYSEYHVLFSSFILPAGRVVAILINAS